MCDKWLIYKSCATFWVSPFQEAFRQNCVVCFWGAHVSVGIIAMLWCCHSYALV